MDSDVGRDGEEGYNLREMGSDGQGGWEEGGVDGSAGGGVSATAAAMEWSMSGYAATLRGRLKTDWGLSEDGEDGYELREVENDGRRGWEEGGVDGSAGVGVSATAAAMEWSLSGRRQLRVVG